MVPAAGGTIGCRVRPSPASGSARSSARQAPVQRRAPRHRTTSGRSPPSWRSRAPTPQPTTSCSGPCLLLGSTRRSDPPEDSHRTASRPAHGHGRSAGQELRSIASGGKRCPAPCRAFSSSASSSGARRATSRRLRRRLLRVRRGLRRRLLLRVKRLRWRSLPRTPEGVGPMQTARRDRSASPADGRRAASAGAGPPPTAGRARSARRSSASAVPVRHSASSPGARTGSARLPRASLAPGDAEAAHHRAHRAARVRRLSAADRAEQLRGAGRLPPGGSDRAPAHRAGGAGGLRRSRRASTAAFRRRPGSSPRCPRGRSTRRDSCPGTAGGSPRRRRTPAPRGSRW